MTGNHSLTGKGRVADQPPKTVAAPSGMCGPGYNCAPMTLTSGTKLGPYEMVSPLGAGGMGEVYRARDTRRDREVAIKVLPSDLSVSAPSASQRSSFVFTLEGMLR